jgi:hypothetical protein
MAVSRSLSLTHGRSWFRLTETVTQQANLSSEYWSPPPPPTAQILFFGVRPDRWAVLGSTSVNRKRNTTHGASEGL